MAFTFAILGAATKYGLDDPANLEQVLGTPGDPRIDGTGAVGTYSTITIPYAGGFTAAYTVYISSTTTATLSLLTLKSPIGEILISSVGAMTLDNAKLGTELTGAYLYSGADSITGNSGDNTLEGFGGNDRIDGGGGTDTAVFQGLSTQYSLLSRSGSSMTISGPDGTDTLLNIERLQFDNSTIAFDTAGTAGKAYRIYQAAFNRTPDSAGLGYWIHTLDHGATLSQVAQGFINSPEFSSKYGNLDDSHFASQLYQNVLHRAPDAGGLSFWTDNLNAGRISRAETVAQFSESPENQAAVIGAIQNGIIFTS